MNTEVENVEAEDIPKRRERRDAQVNREHILAIAKQLFTTYGIDATTMQEVARAAGVGQGTLYRNFADKGELCHGLIREDIAAFQTRVGALISDTETIVSPLARLEILIVEKIRLTESHLPLFAAIDDAAAGARRTKPFRGPFNSWAYEHIIALLTEAVAKGEIATLDMEFTADAILAAIAPPLYSHHRQERGYNIERIVAGVRYLFIDGLRRPTT